MTKVVKTDAFRATLARESASRAILDLANSRVRITCPDSKRRTVTLLEARLIELTSPTCRRRLLCQDFISMVRTAAQIQQRINFEDNAPSDA
ncbi:hypothetical protein [Sphingobium sp. B11D3D]|uniref:hypothetical protein n=1 Tax=Sphingobium sp. B11D3D TaxID=2940576 RepID=UPI0022254F73|nr:hypothetical protein [Sphingobium sp. B11D3D]MCW2370786.1 hypothetical protein [Sphingobium sp. B11D3D]